MIRKLTSLLALASGLAAMLYMPVGWVQSDDTTSSVLEGVYTEAQATRGTQVYTQRCAVCHGATLGGLGEAPALVSAQFISDFNGLTVGELFSRIRTTMPLNDPSSLSREQYADVLAFILKSNGFPPGQRELDHRSEFLNVIRFEAPP
jgi:mono/diheme cytochrome c family protein